MELVEVGFGLDVEMADAAGKASWGIGEGFDLDADGVAGQRFDNGLVACWGEERIVDKEVEDGTGSLSLHLGLDDGDDVGFERGDVEGAVFLRIEGSASYFGHLVLPSVVCFGVLLNLRHIFAKVFAPKAFVARQFVDLELRQGDLSVDFVYDDGFFALIEAVFADGSACKKCVVVDVLRCLRILLLLLSRTLLLLSPSPSALVLLLVVAVRVGFFDLDRKRLAGDGLPVDRAAGGTDIGSAFFFGLHKNGEGVGNRLRHLAVDDGCGAAESGVGTSHQFQTFQGGGPEILSAGIDVKCYLECLSCRDGVACADVHHGVLSRNATCQNDCKKG